jgi:membrane protein
MRPGLNVSAGRRFERGRAVAAGHPIEQEPFSELRDDRKLRKEKNNLLRR